MWGGSSRTSKIRGLQRESSRSAQEGMVARGLREFLMGKIGLELGLEESGRNSVIEMRKGDFSRWGNVMLIALMKR